MIQLHLAGEPGDRWLALSRPQGRRRARREESPDTIVVGSQEPVTNRATRLVTPGDGHAGSSESWSYTRKRVVASLACDGAAQLRKVPQRIDRRRFSTVASRRETCETSSQIRAYRPGKAASFGKGEKVG